MANKKSTKAKKPVSHQKTPPKSAQVSKTQTGQNFKPYLKWAIPLAVVLFAVIIGVILLQKGPSATAADTLPANIGVSDAYQRFTDGAFLLDVRTPEEWNESHVDGAVLIPSSELDARVNEIPTDQDILIICRSGNRSAQARDLLRGYGLKRTTSINGGINSWIASGLPVVTSP